MKLISILLVFIVTSHFSNAQSKRDNHLNFLHTSGQDIINESGKKIYLKEVGLGNWLLPEGYMWKFGGLGDRLSQYSAYVSTHLG